MKIQERSARRLRLVHFGRSYAAISAASGTLCVFPGLSLWQEGDVRDALPFRGVGGGPSLTRALVATRYVSVTLGTALDLLHGHNRSTLGERVRSAPLAVLSGASVQTMRRARHNSARLALRPGGRDDWIVSRIYNTVDGAAHAAHLINARMAHHLPASPQEQPAHEDHT